MFEVLKFIFKCVAQFISMLFTIDIGGMSLGLFMGIIFIFLPIMLTFLNFLKEGDGLDILSHKSDRKKSDK